MPFILSYVKRIEAFNLTRSFCGCFTVRVMRKAQGAKRKHDSRCAQSAMRHAPPPWPPEARRVPWLFSFLDYNNLKTINFKFRNEIYK
jgi:hypothetical protein